MSAAEFFLPRVLGVLRVNTSFGTLFPSCSSLALIQSSLGKVVIRTEHNLAQNEKFQYSRQEIPAIGNQISTFLLTSPVKTSSDIPLALRPRLSSW